MPKKLQLFIWSIMSNKLPVQENIHSKDETIDGLCPTCGRASESTTHLFLVCSFVKQVLPSVVSKVFVDLPCGAFGHKGWKDLLFLHRFSRESVTYIIFCFWHIWRNRNNKVFSYTPAHPENTTLWTLWKAGDFVQGTSFGSHKHLTQFHFP